MRFKAKNKKKGGVVKNHGKRILETRRTMEEYAKVSKALGDKRVMLVLVDGKQMIAHIPGKFTKKKIWVNVDSVVLVSRREFENDKMDIIHLYDNDEVKKLVKSGEIPESFLQSGISQIITDQNDNDEGFDIENSDDENEKVVIQKESRAGGELVESKLDCGFDFDDI
jgi:translation initiation factor 1A